MHLAWGKTLRFFVEVESLNLLPSTNTGNILLLVSSSLRGRVVAAARCSNLVPPHYIATRFIYSSIIFCSIVLSLIKLHFITRNYYGAIPQAPTTAVNRRVIRRIPAGIRQQKIWRMTWRYTTKNVLRTNRCMFRFHEQPTALFSSSFDPTSSKGNSGTSSLFYHPLEIITQLPISAAFLWTSWQGKKANELGRKPVHKTGSEHSMVYSTLQASLDETMYVCSNLTYKE